MIEPRTVMSDQLSADLNALRIDRDPPPRSAAASTVARALAWLAVLAALVGAAAWAVPFAKARVFKTDVQTSEITMVSPAQASTSVSATGYVIALITSRVQPRVPGRVARLMVREGQAVTSGQVLLELDPVEQRAAIASAQARALAAQARVAVARANIAEAQMQLERQQRLVATGSVARAPIEDPEARLGALRAQTAASQAEVRASEAEVSSLRISLGQLTVHAPFDAIVLNRPPQVGELVGAGAFSGSATNASASVIELMDPRSLVVEVDVPEGRFGTVHVGGPCEVSLDAFTDRRFRCAVSELGRRVDRAKATVPVRVRFVDDVPGVLPEMSARVSFLTQEVSAETLRARPRTVLPAAALATRGGASVVFTVDDGAAHMHRVSVGPRLGDGIELLQGPPPGAHVVLHPPAALSDGSPVKESTQ